MTLTVLLTSACDLWNAASSPLRTIKENSIKLNISLMTPTIKIQINSIKMHGMSK
jgi:hypothetical protein